MIHPIAITKGVIGTPKIIGGRVKPLKSGFFSIASPIYVMI
ncbi:hypothetical protein ACM1TD_001783 [Campylobacter jejuni]|nr:hypothetical protein [Campylobacter jejuni]APA80259.1 hypothetical protein CJM129_9410 [Campylobacter jejuni subsp. jejuni M129]APA81996.1 hypothetical protein CJD42_9170 [Campylobacter jejuni subsp. jejuni D42a]MCW1366649.1 hypothetical protein [Campylobacter jejuni]MCW1493710.1 hypothetical protein [Campylobacter jejuni]MCW1530089.1 hypothetical protein [Campylobacter jejuni]